MSKKDELSPEELARQRGDFADDEEIEETDDSLSADDGRAVDDVSEEEGGGELEASEDAEEEEVAETAAEEEVEEDKDEPIMIPKARFDEVQRKARARQKELEQKLANLETTKEVKATNEEIEEKRKKVDELENEWEDLVFEGEKEKARQVRQKMKAAEAELFDLQVSVRDKQTQHATIQQVRFDAMVAQIEAQNPQLNPESDYFDQSLADEVNELISVFEGSGYTPTAALQKAVNYGLRGVTAEEAEEEPEDAAAPIRQRRALSARKRVNDAAKRTPPNVQRAGRNSDAAGVDSDGLPDPTRLTEKQFEQLTAEQLAKLRGDSYVGE